MHSFKTGIFYSSQKNCNFIPGLVNINCINTHTYVYLLIMTDVCLHLSVHTYIHMHIPTLIMTDTHLCLYVCTYRLVPWDSSLDFGILMNMDN